MSCRTLFLLSTACVVTGTMTAATISLKPLPFPGLVIVRATDPSVQRFVAASLGEVPSADIVALLPFSVVLQNATAHEIRAYTLRLSFVDMNGVSGGRNRQYFNFESTPNGMEIPAGEGRLVSPIRVLKPGSKAHGSGSGSASRGEALSSRLRSKTAVAVSIDLIVFDTGQVVGPDEAGTSAYLEGYLLGEREAVGLVNSSLSTGQSGPQVVEQLARYVEQVTTAPVTRLYGEGQASVPLRLLAVAERSESALRDEVARLVLKPPFSLYH